VYFGFFVRVFERVYPESPFDHVYNGGWLIILTMTTIGYGEIYPATHLGRLTAIVACIIGVFLLSLFVVALANTVEFELVEEEAYSQVNRARYREGQLAKVAATFV
jgi:potassium intermediate/small conductance calcium-activated channel subfamily N protein 2